MIRIFADSDPVEAHEAFQAWRRIDPNASFLNEKTEADLVLHKARCWHHGDMSHPATDWGSLAKSRKICGESEQELRDWARTQGREQAIRRCKDCH